MIVAHDATTGAELWRRRTIPAPGEPGNETWGDIPFEDRTHVGTWMVPSYDPALELIYIGTSVTSPAPKFLLGGRDLRHLYHNSTLALNAQTGRESRGTTSTSTTTGTSTTPSSASWSTPPWRPTPTRSTGSTRAWSRERFAR